MAAARVAELALRLRLELRSRGWVRKFVVTDQSPTGDPLLDPLLVDLAQKARSPSTAAERAKGQETAYAERLGELGLVRRQESQTRFLHRPRIRYELSDTETTAEIRDRIVGALIDPTSADLRTIALIAVANRALSWLVGVRLGEGLADAGVEGSFQILRRNRAVRPSAYKQLIEAGQIRDDSGTAPGVCDSLSVIAKTAKTPWEGGGG